MRKRTKRKKIRKKRRKRKTKKTRRRRIRETRRTRRRGPVKNCLNTLPLRTMVIRMRKRVKKVKSLNES